MAAAMVTRGAGLLGCGGADEARATGDRPAPRTGSRAVRAAAAAATVLVLVACGSDDTGSEDAEGPQDPVKGIPLPPEVASTGTITEPALEPRWLDESTGTEESTDAANLDATSGTIVLDDHIVSYGRDIISAVDRTTGKTAWRSDLDMGGGTICDITVPTTPEIEVLTVTYGDEDFCQDVGRISTDDGHEVGTREGDERLAGMATYDDVSYVVDDVGLVTRYRGDSDEAGQPVRRPRGELIVESVAPVRDPDLLVVRSSLPTDQDRVVLTALSVPDLDVVWRKDVREIAPKLVRDAGDVSLNPLDGRFLSVQVGSENHLVQLDPATGEQVGVRSSDAVYDPDSETDQLGLDLPDLQNDPNKLGRVGEDVIVTNGARALSRVAPDGAVRWTFDTAGLTLREGEDAFLGSGPVTPDGTQVLATLHNGRSTDLLAIATESGELVGRWAVPEEYVAGFTRNPYVSLLGNDGVLLTRNLTLFGDTELLYGEPDPRRPYDAGYFAFPAATD